VRQFRRDLNFFQRRRLFGASKLQLSSRHSIQSLATIAVGLFFDTNMFLKTFTNLQTSGVPNHSLKLTENTARDFARAM
jgi:hypothetical protein